MHVAAQWVCFSVLPFPIVGSKATKLAIDQHHNNLLSVPLLPNNASACETFMLTVGQFDRMIEAARAFIAPNNDFLLAFDQSDAYDGARVLWFCDRLGSAFMSIASPLPKTVGVAVPFACCKDLLERIQLLGRSSIAGEVTL